MSSSIKLTRLDFVLIPVLKWTGRRNNLLKAFGQFKKVFDSNKVVLFGQVMIQSRVSKCIMVFNLLT